MVDYRRREVCTNVGLAREYEQGMLTISMPNSDSIDQFLATQQGLPVTYPVKA